MPEIITAPANPEQKLAPRLELVECEYVVTPMEALEAIEYGHGYSLVWYH